jgi:hypothetical protein
MSEIKVNKISPRSGTTLTLGDSGDDFVIPAGATLTNNGTASGFASIAWQSTIVTGTTLSAVAGNGYWIDTTSNACTVTLPASASVGDQIIFSDYARTWGTNAVTINQNSLNFQGYTSPNPVYNTSGQSVTIVYSGATQGWIPTVDDDVTNEVPQAYTVDFLIIAGGGSGGKNVGGGGGAGGYRNSYSTESSGGGGSSETSLSLTPSTVYTITVGAGGTANDSYPNTYGNDGNDSSISGSDITTVTSAGGGGGGGAGRAAGANGGSGGGGRGEATGNQGSGTANQGYDGGAGSTDAPQQTAGGGGGASSVGGNGSGSTGGNGGSALASSITGSSVDRAGGGGGTGKDSGTPGTSGGGGSTPAVSSSSNASDATANTGSGGGASHDGNAGDGGSGIVILRMADADYSGTTTGSPTVTTGVGGTDTVLVFTGSGSYTA